MQEETDPQVRSLVAQHLRNQLQLVVLNPDHCAVGCHLGRVVGEPLVDRDVGLPPLAVELRRSDRVVIERPERRVGEALVVLRDVRSRERDWDEL